MSAELLARWRAGDQTAADELVRMYARRLIALAETRLGPKLRQRIDPEDVVQSAFRSFFRVARPEGIVILPGDDLWALLAKITINKALRRIEHHRAACRSVEREVAHISNKGFNLLAEIAAHEPSPDDVVAVADELRKAMEDLMPIHRQMVEFILQGQNIMAIALATQRTERMVRIVVARFRTKLEGQLLELTGQ